MSRAPYRRIYSPPGSTAVERCRFIGAGGSGGRSKARFELDDEVFEADLVNPEVLRGDLPYGAEVAVAFGGPGGIRAELLLEDADRLPPELRGPTAIVMPPERRWQVRKRLLDRVHQVVRPFPLRVAAWAFSHDGSVRE